ncbi:MAG TPA: tryptophan synthase subunit alpha [Thermoplasmata archaeon]|nr:tryptophan synthase subunit alpha [Thermoplasmata archaeon]
MPRLASALSDARNGGARAVVPYLMVDRRRRARLGATVAAFRGAGAAALELGFPFSDPIADGPTLESAADHALAHGTSWNDLLAQLRIASAVLPTAVMTYANPVWARGLRRATRELRQHGASGLIVPDLSLEESPPWREAAEGEGLDLVLLAAPSASRTRIARIAAASSGFLYLVSRFGTTGGAAAVTAARELAPLVAAAHRRRPELAVLVGFGVRDAASARAATASGADGVVVGSAIEEAIGRGLGPAALGRWLAAIVRGARSAAADRR